MAAKSPAPTDNRFAVAGDVTDPGPSAETSGYRTRCIFIHPPAAFSTVVSGKASASAELACVPAGTFPLLLLMIMCPLTLGWSEHPDRGERDDIRQDEIFKLSAARTRSRASACAGRARPDRLHDRGDADPASPLLEGREAPHGFAKTLRHSFTRLVAFPSRESGPTSRRTYQSAPGRRHLTTLFRISPMDVPPEVTGPAPA